MRKITGRLTLKGIGGQLAVDDHFVTIHRRGLNAKFSHGLKGEKRIPIKQITSVQLKKPGLTNGYIQFSHGGGTDNKSGIFSATKDENSIMFTTFQAEDAYAIRDYIEHYLVHGQAPTEVSVEEPESSPTVEPAEPEEPTAAPGWHSDPYERHELRYFDGRAWTAHVSDGGVQSEDDPQRPPEAPIQF
ncbi:MAG: DUF2510 domain-containing protein [Acidimicrobiales bacterium]